MRKTLGMDIDGVLCDIRPTVGMGFGRSLALP